MYQLKTTTVQLVGLSSSGFTIAVPIAPDVLVVDCYHKVLYLQRAPTILRWDLWQAGSAFWPLLPNDQLSQVRFLNAATGGNLAIGTDITAEVTARGADWLSDTVDIPVVATPGMYGTGLYDSSSYG